MRFAVGDEVSYGLVGTAREGSGEQVIAELAGHPLGGGKDSTRLTGTTYLLADVRLLAATNQDLRTLVQHGRFREDLWYRLNVFTIVLPPLRERGDDLLLLIQHYLRRFNRELGRCVEGISPDALAILRHYSWPGNVRQLQSVLKQALLQATGTVLAADFLPAAVFKPESPIPSGEVPGSLDQFVDEKIQGGSENLYEETLRRMEKLLLTRVLQHTSGNQVQAAKILGITRGSLRTKIRDLGIVIAKSVASGEDSEE